MLVHQRLGFIAARALAHGDQLFARGHDIFDRLIEIGLKAQIAIGDDAHDTTVSADDGQPGYFVLAGNVQHVTHGHHRGNGVGVFDNAAFKAFDFGDFGRLRGGRHVLVNNADAAFLRNRNRQVRLGYRIHGSRYDGNIQVDSARQARFEANLARQHGGMGGNQQNIIEG